MTSATYQHCVIFGGKGYIGSFFAAHLLDSRLADKVYLADISESKRSTWPVSLEQALKDGRLVLVNADVRNEINAEDLPEHCDLICNFAAIHREPGHEDIEYFETNLKGAENVCGWAEKVRCQSIIFTSSIAPYGIQEGEKDESTLPVPVTAYGSSKLAAEKIHIAWQNRDKSNRYLSIARPGVIYGPGEDGNVPRMIRAVIQRYFMFMGNRETRKAGGYIKELVLAMAWVVAHQKEQGQNIVLYNFSSAVAPSIAEYVSAICNVANIKRTILNVPFIVVLAASYVISILARPFGIKHPFSPVRIKKLIHSNDIIPKYLIDEEYPYTYDLDSSFRDWIQDRPEDWLR